MFRAVPLSIIRSSSLYIQQWYMSYRFADSLRVGYRTEKLVGVSGQRQAPVALYPRERPVTHCTGG